MDKGKRDKYLRRKYAITLEEYEKMLAKYDGGCWICFWKPKKEHRSLAVDHDHKVAKAKIVMTKTVSGYAASCPTVFGPYRFGSSNKKVARAKIQKALLRKSVRGLLCSFCNPGLKKFKDNSVALMTASLYLERCKYRNGIDESQH